MPILAIDTATLVSGVALVEGETLLAELTLQTRLTHSEVLMPHIRRILAMAKLTPKELDGIAVSIGPGSFTGLRIGLATAKGLAYALGAPIVGVSTLVALACHYPAPHLYVVPLLDAQKGNAYAALYCWENGALREMRAPFVENFAEILRRCQRMDRPVVFVGETAVKRREEIAAAGGNILTAPGYAVMPRAACVGYLGARLFDEGRRDDVMTLEPLYIRRSEAEVLWERRNGAES